MFTGIITALEKPTDIKKDTESFLLSLPVPKNWELKIGESVSVDGTCLTISNLNSNSFSVYLMKETLDKTTFKDLDETHFFNLEQPLTLNSLVGGHLVTGHIDGVGELLKKENAQESAVLEIKLPEKLLRYLIYKGSVAVNGVSLTVVSVLEKSFTVSLIPYTLENTNLGKLNIGDKVNIELDLIAKYLEGLSKD